MKIVRFFLLLLFLLEFCLSQNSPPGPPQNLQVTSRKPISGNYHDLPNNTWLQIVPNNSMRYIPRGYEPSNVLEAQAEPQGRAYSPPIIGSGLIYYFGGGHHSHPGNDMEIYDIAGNIWNQQYKPEVCDLNDASCNSLYGGSGSGAVTPLGRPYVEHLWQLGSYDPTSNRFLACLSSGFWAFDANTGEWQQILDGNVASLWENKRPNLFDYDPDIQSFPLIITGYNVGVYMIEPDGTYNYRSPLPISGWEFLYNTYIPELKMHFVRGWDEFWWYDAVNNNWTQIQNRPSDAYDVDSFAYDSRNKTIIGVQHDGVFRVWAFEVLTDNWQELPIISTRPNQTTGTHATSNLLMYDEPNNIFFFLECTGGGGGTGGDTKLWAYRYRN
jgi:hypothetical protein